MIQKVIENIDENRDAYVERLFELLRIRSISTDPSCAGEIRRAAEWTHGLFQNCGIKSEIVETDRHPCVLADSGPPMGGKAKGDGPTFLVYGHYDVQPDGDPSLWLSPAFEPTVRDGAVFARGSADDKGQVLTHLLAAEAWQKVAGGLPVRVKFLIEGEEEIGSPSLKRVLRDNAERLACDYVAISDTSKLDADTPAITYGTKGMIYKEIIVTGPKQNLHSGSFGGTVTNPGNALSQIIAALRDSDNRVTIAGFYDDVRDLTDADRARMAEVGFDEAAYQTSTGSISLDGEKGYTTLERRWARPTLDVNGLLSGFTSEGTSTIIPARAMGKVSMRIVPDQDPATISEAFDSAVRRAVPAGVDVEIVTHAVCGAYICPIDSPGMRAASGAIKAGFGKEPVFIREGGSLPILPLFRDILGAESLLMGFAVPECNLHGPNEFFGLSDFHNGIKTAASFMHLLASA